MIVQSDDCEGLQLLVTMPVAQHFWFVIIICPPSKMWMKLPQVATVCDMKMTLTFQSVVFCFPLFWVDG